MRKCVIYKRVSSIKQTKVGDGLASQETRCRQFAHMKGYEVIGVFNDEMSGRFADRPGMKALLAFIRKRRSEGTIVIIDDVSRLARGLQAHLELRASIAKAGGELQSPSIEFGEDPDSILVENLLAATSQHHGQKNAQQTKDRMRSRVQNGYWVFAAPAGYRYETVRGRGKMLRRDEPVATIVQEALEGYASGRFERPADVQRFLQRNPLFPKDSSGIVRHNRVGQMLVNAVYAGLVESPDWGVSRRAGNHEGLISIATYKRIGDRLNGVGYAPRRKNLNEDFPLRGFVVCASCATPLTAYWAGGAKGKHPYYQCFRKGCECYGKSIRKVQIEGEFEELLSHVTPSETVVNVATRIFRDLWEKKAKSMGMQARELAAEVKRIDKQIAQMLDRVADLSVGSVIKSFEQRIAALEEEKLLARERMEQTAQPKLGFEVT